MDLSKTYQPGPAITLKSVEDLPAFRFVSHLGSLCAADTKSAGITEVDYVRGENSAVIISGTILVESSGDIEIGENVTASSGGKAKKAGTGAAINGRALSEAANGDLVKIILVP